MPVLNKEQKLPTVHPDQFFGCRNLGAVEPQDSSSHGGGFTRVVAWEWRGSILFSELGFLDQTHINAFGWLSVT